MDLKKRLTENDLFIETLYKFLDDEGYFEDLKEQLGMYEDPEEGDEDEERTFIVGDFDSVNVVGYRYNEEKNVVEVTVTYIDECSDDGCGWDVFDVPFDELTCYLKEIETEVNNANKRNICIECHWTKTYVDTNKNFVEGDTHAKHNAEILYDIVTDVLGKFDIKSGIEFKDGMYMFKFSNFEFDINKLATMIENNGEFVSWDILYKCKR